MDNRQDLQQNRGYTGKVKVCARQASGWSTTHIVVSAGRA